MTWEDTLLGLKWNHTYIFHDMQVDRGVLSDIAADTDTEFWVAIAIRGTNQSVDLYPRPDCLWTDRLVLQFYSAVGIVRQDDDDYVLLEKLVTPPTYDDWAVGVLMRTGVTATLFCVVDLRYTEIYETRILADDHSEFDLDSIWEDQHDI